jgi:hypothetical protein
MALETCRKLAMSKGAGRIARPTVLFFQVHPDRAIPHRFFVYRPAKTHSVTGRIYCERLQSGWVPVRVLVQWNGRGPRNVLIEREDGSRVVRPFRGLRRWPLKPASLHTSAVETSSYAGRR